MAQTYDLTKGSVTSVILKFYFPMFFTNMLQQIYTIADTAIVGKGISDDALAAVGNMSSVSFLIFGFAIGISNGFAVSAAQAFGAKNYEKLRHSVASSIILSVITTILLTFLSVFFMPQILRFMQTDKKIFHDSLVYGYVIFGGLVTTIAYNLCSCILRALGDSRTPFIAIVVSTAMNVVLDLFLVCTVKTGVAGAGAATVASQLVSTLICYIKLRRIDAVKLTADDFRENGSIILELTANGVPMGLMNSITAVGSMVVQYFVNGLGVDYTKAYSVCSKYINLFIQPACTAGFAMSSFTSQNYGACEYQRIRKGLRTCLSIALVSYAVLGAVMMIFPKELASLMLNGKVPIGYTALYLPICGAAKFMVDILFVVRSGVQGMGHPTIPMISGILEMVMRIAVIVLFVEPLGFTATAYANVAAWAAALLLNGTAFALYLRKKLKAE